MWSAKQMSTLMGATVMHLSIGSCNTLANINTYLTSYFKKVNFAKFHVNSREISLFNYSHEFKRYHFVHSREVTCILSREITCHSFHVSFSWCHVISHALFHVHFLVTSMCHVISPAKFCTCTFSRDLSRDH